MRLSCNENESFAHAQRLHHLHLTRTNIIPDKQREKRCLRLIPSSSLSFAMRVISLRVDGIDFDSEVSAFPRRLSNESKTRLTASDSVYFLAITDKIFPQQEKYK